MAIGTFLGGIRPYDGKELSRHSSIKTVVPHTDIVVFPLKQHMGAPAIPVVRPGDPVLTGQRIAKADGEFSADLHSSISGVVAAVSEFPTADGTAQQSIIVRNDGRFSEIPYPKPRRFSDLTPVSIVGAVRQAGIVGMGGAGLPSHIKLSPTHPEQIDYVIANCVESEPYMTSDYRRMVENPGKLINGLRIVLKMFPSARGILALDEQSRGLYRAFRQYTLHDPRIFVKRLETKYPQGSERQLIYAVTGRELNGKMLPADIGCIVHNVDTLVAINQAVMLYEPLLTRLITVTGDCIARPRNFRVRIGMSYDELIERAGGFVREPALILDGGPLTGRRLTDLHVPITKMSSQILALSRDRVAQMKETACSRCAKCVDVCPNHLVPVQLWHDAAGEQEQRFIAHNGLECCECQCCSYICPSRIPLSSVILGMKERLLSQPEKVGDYSRRLSG